MAYEVHSANMVQMQGNGSVWRQWPIMHGLPMDMAPYNKNGRGYCFVALILSRRSWDLWMYIIQM